MLNSVANIEFAQISSTRNVEAPESLDIAEKAIQRVIDYGSNRGCCTGFLVISVAYLNLSA